MKEQSIVELMKMLYGLDTSESLNFYYDETNNFRKLKITESGFNNDIVSYFVIGGIVFNEEPDLAQVILDSQVIQQNEELKFNDFAKGEFRDILKSLNLRLLLRSFREKEILIHCSVTNYLYWAIVDIVDTALVDKSLLLYSTLYKDTLYNVAKAEQVPLHSIFTSHHFPDVPSEDLDEFFHKIQNLVSSHDDGTHSSLHIQELARLIRRARKSLDWHSHLDCEAGNLFSNDGELYARNVAMFDTSRHVFDNEDADFLVK